MITRGRLRVAVDALPEPGGRNRRRRRQAVHYALALLGYIGIGLVTQRFLTFTFGLLYFVLTLEVLPRSYRFLRYRADRPPFEPGAARVGR